MLVTKFVKMCALPEPHSSTRVSLVPSDQDWMRNRQKTNQSPILQKSQDFTFVCQALVYAHLLNLGDKNLGRNWI
jgi:hypothetical protein